MNNSYIEKNKQLIYSLTFETQSPPSWPSPVPRSQATLAAHESLHNIHQIYCPEKRPTKTAGLETITQET
jgi:hypothetical protein